MLNRLSISVLLKSVIAVLGATVIIMLALGARDSWTRLNTANRISGVANVSAYMFTALNGLRVDRFSTARDLVGETQFATIDSLIKDCPRQRDAGAEQSAAGARRRRLSGSRSGHRRSRRPRSSDSPTCNRNRRPHCAAESGAPAGARGSLRQEGTA